MQSKTTTIIFGWIIILSAGFFGYWIGKNTIKTEPRKEEMREVIEGNTHTIQVIAMAAKSESSNADILLEILNALNGEPVKELPKSIDGLFLSDTPDFKVEDGDEDVPTTFFQIAKDQREIDMGIRSLISSNLFQADTLHTILKKIKESKQ
jgi:hypothetical protein